MLVPRIGSEGQFGHLFDGEAGEAEFLGDLAVNEVDALTSQSNSSIIYETILLSLTN